MVRQGDFRGVRIDPAIPDRTPMPRADIRQRQIPLGPVAVFGASNFPLAFSTAGGDTASALAAGCPVVFKAHNAHPGTSELVGQAVIKAVNAYQNIPQQLLPVPLQDTNPWHLNRRIDGTVETAGSVASVVP
ncbi:acyl-CoA reductase-like NAD-dependent aldehyde dehydrogenase [Arthrobacter pascens]|nr:acyl-CoA reductase-like NAD-dependent aldehyde dehydrogenase [Arthrobacter pascens]